MTFRPLISMLASLCLLAAAVPGRAQDAAPAPASENAAPAPASENAAPAPASENAAPAPASQDAAPAALETGLIPHPKVMLPAAAITSEVFLISDAAGWTAQEQSVADGLLAQGAIVVGIDLPAYLASIEKDDDEDCSYLVSDIEDVSQQTQRAAKLDVYRLPLVGGIGAGGALALAIAAQTPDATIGGTLAVDPEVGIALKRVLCTPAIKTEAEGRAVYGLTEGALPDPVSVVFTPAASASGREHVAALVKEHADIAVSEASGEAELALAAGLKAMIATGADDSNSLGLPLTVLEAKPSRSVMAIIYSGDGGWRDLDKTVGDIFQKDGVPTIGVDSLHYFWSKKTPEQTAKDLQKIIDTYRKRWRVEKVLLVGYSFGADVLPAAYNMLSKPAQSSVAMISLLGLADTASYQVSVTGWLGFDSEEDPSTIDALKPISPKIVQCVYGTDEDDSACLTIKNSGAELVGIDGGHHFDGDYEALAAKILAGLDRRTGGKQAPKSE